MCTGASQKLMNNPKNQLDSAAYQYIPFQQRAINSGKSTRYYRGN